MILSVIVVGALLGLTIVQYGLLRVAIKLEKVRFDKEARLVVGAAVDRLGESLALQEQLIQLREGQAGPRQQELQKLAKAVADSLARLIDSVLVEEGLPMDYAFAIEEGLLSYPVVSGKGFRSAEEEAYRTYGRILQGKLREDCSCDFFFYLQVNNLFPLLMKRLYSILLPSAAFLLVLLAALLFMIAMLAQLRKLDQVKNDFINNLTHELKTPAFSISLLVKLLRQAIGVGDRKRSEAYLSLLQNENEQLKGHINRVLELASMESGHYELEFREQQLHPLLEKIIKQYRHKAESRGGQLNYKPEAAGDGLMGDERTLRSAFQNLLDNALLYGGEPPNIVVSTQNQGPNILVSVADNGPGIAPEIQQYIYEPFGYGNLNPASDNIGVGVGLSIVKQLVNLMGGDLTLLSRLEEGSTFTATLPLHEPT